MSSVSSRELLRACRLFSRVLRSPHKCFVTFASPNSRPTTSLQRIRTNDIPRPSAIGRKHFHNDGPKIPDRKLSDGLRNSLQDESSSKADISQEVERTNKPGGSRTSGNEPRLQQGVFHESSSSNSSDRITTGAPLVKKRGADVNPTSFRDHLNQTTGHLYHRVSAFTTQLNTLTGTDYTPISSLRDAITAQEDAVKAAHSKLANVKIEQTTSQETQAASQKQVVQLLERRSSWSATDLETYMSLIRSEHANEQAVVKARENLDAAETDLENARVDLERMERHLYHEEQVWSDTIRRNSTWVTFGLMGVNIFVLLLGLIVVEPWRRKRLVKEFRSALNEQTPIAASEVITQASLPGDVLSTAEEISVNAIQGQESTAIGLLNPEPVILSTDLDGNFDPIFEKPSKGPNPPEGLGAHAAWFGQHAWLRTSANFQNAWNDLVSDQQIFVTRFDLFSLALQSATVGASVVAMLFAIIWSFPGLEDP